MNFIEDLRGLVDAAKDNRRYAKKEASTKSYLIDPFINILGYKRINPEDVEPEFAADTYGTKTPVDYALKKEGEYIIFVECKPAKTVLSRENTSQLQHYFSTKLDVRFGILTNGLEYRFYSDLEKPNVMDDDPFLTLDIFNLDEKLCVALQQFTKEQFEVNNCIATARRLKYRRKIIAVLTKTFDPLSEEIVKLVVKQVYSGSFTKAIREQFTPLVQEAWSEFLISKDVETDNGPPPPPPPPRPKMGVEEFTVVAAYNGQHLQATLLFDEASTSKSKIRFKGKEYSVTKGADEAIKTINQALVNGPNGWKFWKYSDPDTNELRSISDLRS